MQDLRSLLVTAEFIFGEAAEILVQLVEHIQRNLQTSSLVRACWRSSPAELTVIKVKLADGTIVFHHMCQVKCFCQDVSDRTHSTAWCQRDIKMEILMLLHFLKFSTGRGYGRYPSEGAGLMTSVLVSQGHPQQTGFPCQMLLRRLLGCHPSASLLSVF